MNYLVTTAYLWRTTWRGSSFWIRLAKRRKFA